MSCSANQSSGSSGTASPALPRTYESAACADSCITSPSWPVIVSRPRPGIAVASTNSTSPPTGVHASPVATPGPRGPPARLGEEPAAAEQLARARLGDRHLARRLALGDLAGDLAADRADLALQLADAGLARVVGDDRPQGRIGERDPRRRQAVALDLARHQVALGDLRASRPRCSRRAGSSPCGRAAGRGSCRACSRW